MENSTKKIERYAPEGYLWVCEACGKTSPDLYGGRYASPGWDEGCVMNAELIPIDKLTLGEDGRVTNVCWSDFDDWRKK